MLVLQQLQDHTLEDIKPDEAGDREVGNRDGWKTSRPTAPLEAWAPYTWLNGTERFIFISTFVALWHDSIFTSTVSSTFRILMAQSIQW